jgi:hypothetical protein
MQSYRSHAIINARVNLDEEPIDHQEGSGGKLSRSHLNAGNSSDQVTVFDINDNLSVDHDQYMMKESTSLIPLIYS